MQLFFLLICNQNSPKNLSFLTRENRGHDVKFTIIKCRDTMKKIQRRYPYEQL